MLLRSLPRNFHCAMTSPDESPSVEMVQTKIAEEFDNRKESQRDSVEIAMIARRLKKTLD